MKIIDLNISARAKSCLIRFGYEDINELQHVSDEDLLKIKNFNEKCLQEVRSAINHIYGNSDIIPAIDEKLLTSITSFPNIQTNHFPKKTVVDHDTELSFIPTQENNKPDSKVSMVSNLYPDLSSQNEKNFVYGGINNDMIVDYHGRDIELIIPDGVKKIGREAFKNKSRLERITLPEGLTIIEESAFEKCINLKYIVFPNSLKIIEENAFKNCKYLKNINLPEGIIKVDRDAFTGCKDLLINDSYFLIVNDSIILYTGNEEEINIPNGIISIGDDVFSNNKKLFGITIPDSVIHIGKRAFSNCTHLQSITIPENVQIIEISAFENCKKLKEAIFLSEDTIFGYDIKNEDRLYGGNIFYDSNISKLEFFVYKNSTALDYAIKNSIKYKIITSDGKKSSLNVVEKHNQKILNKILTTNYLAFGYYSWVDISFDYRHNKIYIFSIEAQETIKKERTRNIEDVKEGDVIYLYPVLNDNGKPNCFLLLTEQGKDVGILPEYICNFLAPLYDVIGLKIDAVASYVEPLSKRGPRCRKGILFIDITCTILEKSEQSQIINSITDDNSLFQKVCLEKENNKNGNVIQVSSDIIMDNSTQIDESNPSESIDEICQNEPVDDINLIRLALKKLCSETKSGISAGMISKEIDRKIKPYKVLQILANSKWAEKIGDNSFRYK